MSELKMPAVLLYYSQQQQQHTQSSLGFQTTYFLRMHTQCGANIYSNDVFLFVKATYGVVILGFCAQT